MQELGRFDQSFFVHMVGSFLLFLVLVVAVEVGLRFAVVLYEFGSAGPDRVQVEAERLAGDLKSIMLNRGGPVASRTVYPILERTFRTAGLEIAIEPSPVTVTSIERRFGFTPRGIPAAMPPGRFNEARVDLPAEEFCLQCHVDARVGDVLGSVSVRELLAVRLSVLWSEVELTGLINAIKIVVHVAILFFLLRRLLAPLMSLRSAVARLALGSAGLDTRAEVRSADEFGELAHHLNHFLDRMQQILTDVRRTLGRTVSVNQQLFRVTRDAVAELRRAESLLVTASGDGDVATVLPRLVHQMHELRHRMSDLGFLESQLDEVADLGAQLLDRLERPDSAVPDSTDLG